jgi:hypothetical protein
MTDRNTQAALALHRFGLEPRAGQLVDPDRLESGEALRRRSMRRERRGGHGVTRWHGLRS